MQPGVTKTAWGQDTEAAFVPGEDWQFQGGLEAKKAVLSAVSDASSATTASFP